MTGESGRSVEDDPSSLRDWLRIYLTGICMGGADMVPGISGGTIALVAGIYERLVTALAALDPRAFASVRSARAGQRRRRLVATLESMDVPFLLVLGAGIATAVLAVSWVIPLAFERYPVAMSAFFFALMAASAVVIYRSVPVETAGQRAVGVVGAVLAFGVSGVTAAGGDGSLPIVVLAGAIAVSAMVLPGISGAAFLYVLGQYQYLMASLNEFLDAVAAIPRGGGVGPVIDTSPVIAAFAIGAVLGLLTMARAVAWALERYRVALLVFLVGLMVGALRLPIEQAAAETIPRTPGRLAAVVLALVVGAGAVFVLDRRTDSLEYA